MTRPVLIAECCQNHNGNREILKRMVHEAAAAGADYAKIQTIRSREVAFRDRFEEGVSENGVQKAIKRPYKPEVERLAKLDLSPEVEAWFVDECRRAGIASMTTIFTRAGVREVEGMGFSAVKVASYDCKSYPLLRDLKKHWSTIIVSTGATFDAEIARAAEELAGADVTFLHCVTLYPTPLSELHLRRMDWLRRFSPKVGFSDHTKPADTGLKASKAAYALGADCIERHYTVLEASESRDGPVSINPAQLKELRAFADRPRPDRMAILQREYPEWTEALGQVKRQLSPAELLNRDYYAGRFASQIGGQTIYNWEDVDIDGIIAGRVS
jgi:N,N'-diacetyllegionaminate synthase